MMIVAEKHFLVLISVENTAITLDLHRFVLSKAIANSKSG